MNITEELREHAELVAKDIDNLEETLSIVCDIADNLMEIHYNRDTENRDFKILRCGQALHALIHIIRVATESIGLYANDIPKE